MSVTFSLPCDQIHTIGRADTRSDSLAFDWTNSGVLFRFCGKSVTFTFETPALSQSLYVNMQLDSIRSRVVINSDHTSVTVCAQEDGEHRMLCTRSNEVLDAVPLILRTVSIDGAAPALLDKPALPQRRMLFIGDSITCGYGNMTDGPKAGFTTIEQDGSKTFAALTASHFGAQAQFIAMSGRGVVRNCDNFQAPLLPELFELTTVSNPTPWDHSQYQPDIVVINAGTNDTAGEIDPVDVTHFKDGVKAFIQRLRMLYPNTILLWCYGMMAGDMHDALKEVISGLEDANLHYLAFQSIYAMENEIGASSHPNLRGHYRCAGVLIDTVHALTGWDK